MKLKSSHPTKSVISLVAVMVVGLAIHLHAQQTQPGRAEVRGVEGSAVYAPPGGTPMPLKTGTILQTGTTIKTGKKSTVDLFLGNSAGVLRVTENTTLVLDKLLFTDTGADTVVEVQLNLPEGTILGNVNKLSGASKFEIKVPNGVAGIRGTTYRMSSSSYIVLLEGTMVFVHVPAGGQPKPYTLQAPPPVYFSPLEGVKPAPEDLVTEIRRQLGPPFMPPGPPSAVPFKDPHISPGTGAKPR